LSVALRAEQRVAWVKKKKIPFFSEWEERLSGCPRVRKSVPEHARENPLAFKATPPKTILGDTTISLLLKKIALFNWSDG